MPESAPPSATLSGHVTTPEHDRTEPTLFGPIPAVRPLRTARSSSGRKAHVSAANAPLTAPLTPIITAPPPAIAESAPSSSTSSVNGPNAAPPRTGMPPANPMSSASAKTSGFAAADAAPLAALLIVAIKIPIGMALLVGWAVVGLSVWLPLVARAVFAFFGTVLYCTLRGLPGPDGAKLHAAIAFYLVGFSKIAAGLLNSTPSHSSACETDPMSEAAVLRAKLDAVWFVFDVLFLLAFWAVALLLALLVAIQ